MRELDWMVDGRQAHDWNVASYLVHGSLVGMLGKDAPDPASINPYEMQRREDVVREVSREETTAGLRAAAKAMGAKGL